VFAALFSTNVFPLVYTSLTPGAHSVSLVRGANAYLRFTVAAGATANLSWGTVPATVQFTLIRTR
jgi:hypothetical protein